MKHLAAVLLILGPTAAFAQSPQMEAYVREGLAQNLGLKQQHLMLEQSRAGVREARGLFLPSITATTRMNELRGNALDIGRFVNPAYAALNQVIGANLFPTDIHYTLPSRRETQIQLLQPLFQPAILFNYQAQSSLADAQEAATGARIRALVEEIKTAYLDYAKSVRVSELYDATLVLLKENVRVSERLVESGQATADVLLRARADLSEVEQQQAEARKMRTAAGERFNMLLDRPAEAEIMLDPALDSVSTDSGSLPGADDAVLHAARHREELRQLDAAAEAADDGVSAITASYLPTIGAGITLGYQGDAYDFRRGKDYTVYTLSATWNIFNGLQDASRREQAVAERERLLVQRRETEKLIALQVRMTHDDVIVGGAAIQTARDRLASARRGFEMVAKRFEQGMAPQVEYLNARTSYTAAGINEIVTRYDYLSRRVRYERAAALGSYQTDSGIE